MPYRQVQLVAELTQVMCVMASLARQVFVLVVYCAHRIVILVFILVAETKTNLEALLKEIQLHGRWPMDVNSTLCMDPSSGIPLVGSHTLAKDRKLLTLRNEMYGRVFTL